MMSRSFGNALFTDLMVLRIRMTDMNRIDKVRRSMIGMRMTYMLPSSSMSPEFFSYKKESKALKTAITIVEKINQKSILRIEAFCFYTMSSVKSCSFSRVMFATNLLCMPVALSWHFDSPTIQSTVASSNSFGRIKLVLRYYAPKTQ